MAQKGYSVVEAQLSVRVLSVLAAREGATILRHECCVCALDGLHRGNHHVLLLPQHPVLQGQPGSSLSRTHLLLYLPAVLLLHSLGGVYDFPTEGCCCK